MIPLLIGLAGGAFLALRLSPRSGGPVSSEPGGGQTLLLVAAVVTAAVLLRRRG